MTRKGSTEECHYDRRVARGFRLVASNVLWFDWCGWVHDVQRGTYDLSTLLRNIAVAGALHVAAQGKGREGDAVTIKLGDLKMARAEASGEPWKVDVGVYEDPMDDGAVAFVRGPMLERRRDESYADHVSRARADSIAAVATNEAADVLIEIAECALELGPAKIEAAKARHELARTHNWTGRNTASDYAIATAIAEVERCERAVRDLESRHAAALSKVAM